MKIITYIFVASLLVISCQSQSKWNEAVRMNSWLYQVKIIGEFDSPIDSISLLKYTTVIKNWRLKSSKVARFYVNTEKLYFTKRAFNEMNSIMKIDTCYYPFQKVKYFVYPYKNESELKFFKSCYKNNKSFIIKESQTLYAGNNLDKGNISTCDSVGLYIYEYLPINNNMIFKLIECK